jgi:hypothetical protein
MKTTFKCYHCGVYVIKMNGSVTMFDITKDDMDYYECYVCGKKLYPAETVISFEEAVKSKWY